MSQPEQRLDGIVYPNDARHDSYISQGILGGETLQGALIAALSKHAERIAIGKLDQTITYGRIDRESTRLAYALRQAGLSPLDRVLFQLPNSPDLIVALIACWKANLIPVATLQAHREAEIGVIGEASAAKAIFVPEATDKFDHPAFAEKMKASLPALDMVVISGGNGPMSLGALMDGVDEAQAEAFVAAQSYDPYQACVFQLSGGTTGVPKLIPRFSSEYLYNMRQVAAVYELTHDDAVFMPLPMIHNAGMACSTFPALLCGAELVMVDELTPPIVLGTLSERKPTIMGAAGPMLARLKAVGVKAMLDLSRLRLVIGMNTAQLAEEALGGTGMHIFGMSEGLIMLTRPDQSAETRYVSVGWPVSEHDEVKLLRPGTEEPVEDGDVGELVVRGPYTLRGYYKAEARNKEAFTSDGFYRSGDLLSKHSNSDGAYYVFEGRIKDVVDRGGEKINCEEVERAGRLFEAVGDIAIVPVPDQDMGERACAFIIPAALGGQVTVQDLGGHLEAQGLAKFKWPERVVCVEEFPTTKAGKTDKAALKEQAARLVEEAV